MMRRRRESHEDRESFSPWESYSDLYCGLLLVFVLLFFFAIYQYIQAKETNHADTQALHAEMRAEQEAVLALYAADMANQQAELEEKNSQLVIQESALAITMADLDNREAKLRTQSETLDAQQTQLETQQTQLETQQAELDSQQALLETQQAELESQQALLETQQAELESQQTQLDSQQTELETQRAALESQQTQLDSQQTQLAQQETLLAEKEQQLSDQSDELAAKEEELQQQSRQLLEQEALLSAQESTINEQQRQLEEQAQQLEAVVGVRSLLIEALNEQLRANDIQLQADKATGAIVFDSSVLFEVGSTEMSEAGKSFIRTFVPIYMEVLLSDEFREYIAEVIIEGHTDDTGSYMYNLELSQQRALTVAEACISEDCDFLSPQVVSALRSLISINGCSFRSPVLNEDGTINPEKSRRVEIKFRLTDEEMIQTLEGILNK